MNFLESILGSKAPKVYADWADWRDLYPEAQCFQGRDLTRPRSFDATALSAMTAQVLETQRHAMELLRDDARVMNFAQSHHPEDILPALQRLFNVQSELGRYGTFLHLLNEQQSSLEIDKNINILEAHAGEMLVIHSPYLAPLKAALTALSEEQAEKLLENNASLQPLGNTFQYLLWQSHHNKGRHADLDAEALNDAVSLLKLKAHEPASLAKGISGVIRYQRKAMAMLGMNDVEKVFRHYQRINNLIYESFFPSLKQELKNWGETLLAKPRAPKKLTYTWEEAKQIVVEAFTECHPELGEVASKAFHEQWVRAVSKTQYNSFTSKYLGAESYPQHPYICVEFKGDLTSLKLLAHEMGHLINYEMNHGKDGGPHDSYLASEIPSHLGEVIVRNALLKRYADKPEELYAIRQQFDTVRLLNSLFQSIIAMTEIDLHKKMNKEGLDKDISYDVIEQINNKHSQDLLGIKGNMSGFLSPVFYDSLPLTKLCYPLPTIVAQTIGRELQTNPQKTGEAVLRVMKNPTHSASRMLGELFGEKRLKEHNFWPDQLKKITADLYAHKKAEEALPHGINTGIGGLFKHR